MTQREKRNVRFLIFAALAAVIFLFLITDNVINAPGGNIFQQVGENLKKSIAPDPNIDIEAQKPLSNPPEIIKAIYATNWSASSEKKIKYFLDLLNTTELNAIVIDIKDYRGVVAWPKIVPRINALIKRFHDAGVYVIGRIAVFQDGELVKTRPDLALHSSSTGAVWGDNKGVHWLDTASRDVWDYNASLASDALARGFDEINFDYIRFPSDGNISDIVYPFYDRVKLKTAVLSQFFAHMREKLPGAKLSADFFGESTYTDDSGIGQRMSDVLGQFDYVAPMIYPSHYASGFNGYKNPAEHPYEVVHYSMDQALWKQITYGKWRIENASSTESQLSAISHRPVATFRPWLQDFNLGANYDAAKVRAQIQALDDLSASSSLITGWMLWNPSNIYTKAALLSK